MTATEVLHTLQARDIRLTVDEGRLTYDAPEGAMTDEVLSLVRQHKTALLGLLQQGHMSTPDTMVRRAETPTHALALAAPASVAPSSIEKLKIPTAVWRCFCCQGTRHWRSVHNVLICRTCHPPPDARLIASREGEA